MEGSGKPRRPFPGPHFLFDLLVASGRHPGDRAAVERLTSGSTARLTVLCLDLDTVGDGIPLPDRAASPGTRPTPRQIQLTRRIALPSPSPLPPARLRIPANGSYS